MDAGDRDQGNIDCAARLIKTVVAPATGITAEQTASAKQLMDEVIVPKFQALIAGETTAQAMYDEIVKQAEAYQESKINEATGQAARFTELFNEYQKYPLITKQRLFYEAMEDILPDMKLYIVDDATGVQTSLPLESYATVNMGGDAQ